MSQFITIKFNKSQAQVALRTLISYETKIDECLIAISKMPEVFPNNCNITASMQKDIIAEIKDKFLNEGIQFLNPII